MTTKSVYNTKGLLTNLKTEKGNASIRNFEYKFDDATGNLTSRKGMTGAEETFFYDTANRLDSVKQGNTQTMAMEYYPNGNIKSKTGLGKFYYGNGYAGPHALTEVENPGELINPPGQEIGYTPFNKASWLIDTIGTDAYRLDITYGPDQQRWKTILKKNGYETKKIIFAGDYEKVTENGVTQELYYIAGGEGLAAVYVRQAGVADQIYYAHADHLGSIISLTDGDGVPVFKATYDAWGKQTITNHTFKFHRGYTGHEHLDEFGLINMNGRMYDPMVGRFLSPDPYVQDPEFSQSFNRYSYCLNNPLVYTDPDGELVWFIPVIVGAIVGAYAGASIQSGTAAFWDWQPNAWQGAIAGAIVGATLGYGFSAAIGASGMTTTVTTAAGGVTTNATKAAGLVGSMLNSGSLNIAMNAISDGGWDGAWKAGIGGVLSGGWTATGGFGLVKQGLVGKTIYQNVGLGIRSVSNNLANGESAFHRYNVGIGPLQLTLGKGIKWHQSLLNINNVFNGLLLLNTAIDKNSHVAFDKKNLSFNFYSKSGLIDKYTDITGSTGAYSIIGSELDFDLEETFHVWQSRSMGNSFLLNYFFNFLSKPSIYNSNYYEATAGYYWLH